MHSAVLTVKQKNILNVADLIIPLIQDYVITDHRFQLNETILKPSDTGCC